jgi:hypothetical protein
MPIAAELAKPSVARAAAPRPFTLKDAFAALATEHSEAWAWANYERVVRQLAEASGAKRLIEIGGGRDPLFGREALAALGAELTVNDISPVELAALPKGYRTACFDIAGELTPEEIAGRTVRTSMGGRLQA